MREAIATIRLSLACLEGFGARRSGRLEVRDALGVESENVGQNFVRMLAQKRRAFDPHFVVRELHRRTDCDVFSTLRMINRLAEPTEGRSVFDGIDVTALRGRDLRKWRARSGDRSWRKALASI